MRERYDPAPETSPVVLASVSIRVNSATLTMDGNLPHGAVMKITLFKVGRRGCWFLSLCENFTV
jgi:hypothetical protein